MQNFIIRASLSDPYDGALRLLNDASRFGIIFQELNVGLSDSGLANIELKLCATPEIDIKSVSDRMLRHISVFDLAVVNTDENAHIELNMKNI